MAALGFLLPLWNKFGTYIIIVGLAFALVGAIYMKGQQDAQREADRITMQRDVEIRRQADEVRRDADAIGDPAERLRRWERTGP